jgi:hypothetical protein
MVSMVSTVFAKLNTLFSGGPVNNYDRVHGQGTSCMCKDTSNIPT